MSVYWVSFNLYYNLNRIESNQIFRAFSLSHVWKLYLIIIVWVEAIVAVWFLVHFLYLTDYKWDALVLLLVSLHVFQISEFILLHLSERTRVKGCLIIDSRWFRAGFLCQLLRRAKCQQRSHFSSQLYDISCFGIDRYSKQSMQWKQGKI